LLFVEPRIADSKRIADPTGKLGNCSLPFPPRWRISGKSGNRPLPNVRLLWGSKMTKPDVASAALVRAWSAYRLINQGIAENDERRTSLERFIRQRLAAGVDDVEMLAVAGLKFLKQLDQSGTASEE
jgi:hypothetical protein